MSATSNLPTGARVRSECMSSSFTHLVVYALMSICVCNVGRAAIRAPEVSVRAAAVTQPGISMGRHFFSALGPESLGAENSFNGIGSALPEIGLLAWRTENRHTPSLLGLKMLKGY